jgi:hypothetical protein
MTLRALDLLNSRRNDPYDAAIASLREDTQQWWADILARSSSSLAEERASWLHPPVRVRADRPPTCRTRMAARHRIRAPDLGGPACHRH